MDVDTKLSRELANSDEDFRKYLPVKNEDVDEEFLQDQKDDYILEKIDINNIKTDVDGDRYNDWSKEIEGYSRQHVISVPSLSLAKFEQFDKGTDSSVETQDKMTYKINNTSNDLSNEMEGNSCQQAASVHSASFAINSEEAMSKLEYIERDSDDGSLETEDKMTSAIDSTSSGLSNEIEGNSRQPLASVHSASLAINSEETISKLEYFDKDTDAGSLETEDKMTTAMDNTGRETVFPTDVGSMCKICNKQFKYAGNLETHLQKHLQDYIGKNALQSTKDSPVKSEPTEKIHTVPNELTSIEDAIQAIINSQNHCSVCNKYFQTSRQYRKHMSIHSTQKRYKCDSCEKSFNVPSKLQRHQQTHTGDKPHLCDTCNKQFSTADNLKKHNLIHTGEKYYTCDRCSRQFTQAVNLKQHLQTHANEKQWICEICTAQFKTTISLRKHMERHKGIKNHLCEICSKPFAEASKLKIHKLTHTGEKNYCCSICGMKFITSGNMRRHELRHTEVKSYACTVCGKAFAQAGNMRVHMRTHEKPLSKNAQRKIATDKAVGQSIVDKITRNRAVRQKGFYKEEGDSDVTEENDSDTGSLLGVSNNESVIVGEVVNESDVIVDITEESEVTNANNEQLNANQYRSKRKTIPCVDKDSLNTLFKKQRKSKRNKQEDHHTTDENGKIISTESVESDIKIKSDATLFSEDPLKQSYCNRDYKSNRNDVSSETEHADDTIMDGKLSIQLPNTDDTNLDIKNVKTVVANFDGNMYMDSTNGSANDSTKLTDMINENGYRILLNESSNDGNECDYSLMDNDYEPEEMNHENPLDKYGNIHSHDDVSNDSSATDKTDYSGETIDADLKVDIQDLNANEIDICQNNDGEKGIDKVESTNILNDIDEILFTQISSKKKDVSNSGPISINCLPKADVSLAFGQNPNTDLPNGNMDLKFGEIQVKDKELFENSFYRTSKSFTTAFVNKEGETRVQNTETDFSMEVETINCDSKDEDKSVLSCEICDQVFQEAEHLKKHLYQHIYTNMKSLLTCQVCELTFQDESSLKEHVLKDHRSNNPNMCNICNKEYDTPRKFKKHMQTHIVNKQYMCEVCCKTCPSPSKLQIHRLSHTGQKPHLCVICSQQFSTASNLKKHSLIHTGERPYTCDRCSKSFTQAGNLREHMLTHSEEKQWTCKICQAEFKSSARLKTHMRLVHTGDNLHSCEICSKSFSESSKLRRHMLIHTGEKPYACDICGIGFTTSGNLKKHGLIHTGEKSYSCQTCGRSFTQSGNLKAHMLTHNK